MKKKRGKRGLFILFLVLLLAIPVLVMTRDQNISPLGGGESTYETTEADEGMGEAEELDPISGMTRNKRTGRTQKMGHMKVQKSLDKTDDDRSVHEVGMGPDAEVVVLESGESVATAPVVHGRRIWHFGPWAVDDLSVYEMAGLPGPGTTVGTSTPSGSGSTPSAQSLDPGRGDDFVAFVREEGPGDEKTPGQESPGDPSGGDEKQTGPDRPQPGIQRLLYEDLVGTDFMGPTFGTAGVPGDEQDEKEAGAAAPVPEPTTVILLGLSLLSAGGYMAWCHKYGINRL